MDATGIRQRGPTRAAPKIAAMKSGGISAAV